MNRFVRRTLYLTQPSHNFFYTEADEDEPAAVAAVEAPAAAKTSGKKRLKLINQFNYCERAALTYNNPSRVCSQSMNLI